MTNAPEKIWTQPDKKGYCITGVWPYQPSEQRNMTEYTRTDVALAMVAAAYEAGADCVTEADSFELATEGTTQITQRIYNTQGDAQAALERVKSKARNEALREALAIAGNQVKAAHTDEAQVYCNKTYDDIEAILALMGEDD